MKVFVVSLTLLAVVSCQDPMTSMMAGLASMAGTGTGTALGTLQGLAGAAGGLGSNMGGMGGMNPMQALQGMMQGNGPMSVGSGPLSTFVNMLPENIRNMPVVRMFINALNRFLSMIPGMGGNGGSQGSGMGGFTSQMGGQMSSLGNALSGQMGSLGGQFGMGSSRPQFPGRDDIEETTSEATNSQ